MNTIEYQVFYTMQAAKLQVPQRWAVNCSWEHQMQDHQHHAITATTTTTVRGSNYSSQHTNTSLCRSCSLELQLQPAEHHHHSQHEHGNTKDLLAAAALQMSAHKHQPPNTFNTRNHADILHMLQYPDMQCKAAQRVHWPCSQRCCCKRALLGAATITPSLPPHIKL